MHPKEIVTQVETADEYRIFHTDHPDYYLTMVFSLGADWKVGYYSKQKDKMVVFSTDPVKAGPPEDVFKKEGVVEPLHLDKVKIEIETLNKECEVIRAAKYGLHPVAKKIIVLQNHEGTVYNVTMLTSTFHVINIKVNATTGDIIKDSIQAAMSFQQKKD